MAALPTDHSDATLLRYQELGEALLAQFPNRFTQLDCGPDLGVKAFWASDPSPAELAAFIATVDGWSWTSTPDDLLDLNLPALRQRVACALVVRASSYWTGLSAPLKARVLAIIDTAAQKIAAVL